MKRNSIRSMLLLTAMICGFGTVKAVYTPVALTGFNADVVANGIGTPTTSTTFAFDGTANVLIAPDYKLTSTSAAPTYALPASGIINSIQTPGITYQLASYTGNNSLRLQTLNQSGTLAVVPNNLIGEIFILGASGDGATTANITVTFTDNTTQVFTGISFPDWFNNTPFAAQGLGRANRNTGVIDAGAGASNPRLYERKLALNISNYTKQIASITVQKTTSTGVLNIMGVTIDHQTCLPVQGMASSAVTTTTANLTWNAATGSQGYEYVLQTSPIPPASGAPLTTNSYNATGLQVGTTYYLLVRNKCGATSYSVWNVLQFSTLPCPSAGAPAISNNVPGSVTVSWPGSTATGVAGYQYIVHTSAVAPTTGWQTTTNTTASVSNLTPGVTYYAFVRSNCTSSQAAWSNSGSFVNPFPPCYAPANITVSNINMHGADIVWNKSIVQPPAQGYQYVVTTATTPPPSGTNTTDTFRTALNLTEGTTYRVYVRTHCGTTNYSPWDSVVFTTPSVCLGPLAPTISNLTHNSAHITWTNYPGIHSFEYFINNSPVAPGFAGIPINFNAISPLNLNSGTTYFFHLRTRCDTANYSAWTTTPFTTLINCTSPGIPAITSQSSTTASFAWSAVPGAATYEYVLDTVTTQPAFGTPVSTTTYNATNLVPDKNYCFFVRAICSASDMSVWENVCFNTSPSSVASTGNVASFRAEAYPNPVTDVVYLRTNAANRQGTLILSDMSGKTIRLLPATDAETRIDMSGLSPGLYLLKYYDNKHTAVIKLQRL